MRVELMIEGQEDVTWPQWLAIAQACEEHGVGTLFRRTTTSRSRATTSAGRSRPGRRSPAWRPARRRLRLGALVSPATFRHPSVLAKTVTRDRPHLGRARRARPRRRLARVRALGFRVRVPAARRAHGDARGAARRRPRRLGRRPVLVRRRALPPGLRRRPPEAGAATAPAADHRRGREASQRAPGSPLRR